MRTQVWYQHLCLESWVWQCVFIILVLERQRDTSGLLASQYSQIDKTWVQWESLPQLRQNVIRRHHCWPLSYMHACMSTRHIYATYTEICIYCKHTVIHSRTKIYVTTQVSDVYSTFVVFHSSNSPASPSSTLLISTRFSVTAFWYVPFYLILCSGMTPGHEHGTHCLFYK